MKFGFATAVAAACLWAMPAAAQDVVKGQLDKAGEVLGSDGYRPMGFEHISTMGTGKDSSYPVELTEGTRYYFAAACDHDCKDLDLLVKDRFGGRKAEDIGDDDVPITSFTPEATGTYTVQVVMAECTEGPCAYGVRGFVKP